jgi:hypothetical protein
MTLELLLQNAKAGTHAACAGCVWKPNAGRAVAFGTSCLKHGINWHSQLKAISVQISQDPAGTTPEKTGCLCAVCNSANATDHSAQQGIALWRAGVERDSDGDGGARFLSRHYWTNAVMHGTGDRWQLSAAQASCTAVLRDQIGLLAPRVIIACGTYAAASLQEIGVLKGSWQGFRPLLRRGAYQEEFAAFSERTTVFVTYHTSAEAVNRTVARFYDDDVELLLEERLAELPTASEARRFLRLYPNATTPGRGMRVLLLHWLEIGKSIRAAHGATV